MRKFSCDEARVELSDALAGVIGRPEANVLEAHLLECDPCRSLAELFLWQDRVLNELSAQARMDHLVSRVRAGLAHLDQVAVTDRPAIRIPRPNWGWVAAAAAFAIALAGVLFWKPETKSGEITKVTVPDHKEAPQPEIKPETPEVVQQTPEPVPPLPEPQVPAPPAPAVTDTVKTPKPAPVTPVKTPDPVPTPNDPKPAPLPVRPADVVTKAPDAVQKAKSLEEAVRNGMAYIKSKAAVFVRESKNDELLLWTYYQAGVPESDPEFKAALKPLLEKKLEKTYNVALMAMLLEDIDRVKYQPRLAQCAQFLLDNQALNGQWGYGEPSLFVESIQLPPAPKKGKRTVVVTRKRDGPAAGDNSNSMYAMLGLRACHDAGILLPPASIELAAKWWRDTQTKISKEKAPAIVPEGWCYSKHEHKPYGSMTAGGVGSLVICDYILARDWKKDREVLCGMEWLAKNFSVAYNPGPYEHAAMEENSQHQYYYYMYALERAAILFGTEQIGGKYWFAKGAEALIGAQRPDGSWKSAAGGNELHDTCFAVLTLRKATRALVGVETK
jgi:hypothetical protein